jgi:outer membrane protein OmpA-like peptidoglycan-associated protein
MIRNLFFGKFFVAGLLAGVLVFGVNADAMAQAKKTGAKPKTAQGTKKAPAKKPAAAQTQSKSEVELPYNSNDCLFAIPLQADKPYGPTTMPMGGGRVQEVVADKQHPNLFEREHNSVWYKFKAPYGGQMEISIVQRSEWDDYDFLVYKNTGAYFSNQVVQNKVLPVAVNMASVDSAALGAAALKANEKGGKAGAKPKKETSGFEMETAPQPHIGMSVDAKDKMLTKKQYGKFIKSIPVKMGEEYYIVLDNVSGNGMGHTITVSVHADAYEPLVLFYDRKARRYVDVDLMILERGMGGVERQLVKDPHYRGGKVKFVPGFSYTLYAKKEGYFSVYREFSARELMLRDTVMMYSMERTERGSTFPVKDIYFEDGEATLIANYDSVLMDYVAMFRNHPDITFLVKGYVQTYGVNSEADMLLSLERAKSVKEYFVKNGIDAKRITTSGMTKNEIKRAAAAALDKGEVFSGVKVELIITGKLGDN